LEGREVKSAAGPLFFAVLAFLSLGGSYAMWPSDFFSTPLSGTTGGTLLRAVAAIVLGFGAVEFLLALAIATKSDN
jgi:hypothetical protein